MQQGRAKNGVGEDANDGLISEMSMPESPGALGYSVLIKRRPGRGRHPVPGRV